MIESIINAIANVVRRAVRSAGAYTHNAPWLTTAAILMLFAVV